MTEPPRRLYREPDSRRPVMPEPAAGSDDHNQWRYGVGKRRAEAVFLSLRRRHGVRGLVLRLPIVLGEGDPTLRLWAWLERMLDGGPVLVPDAGRRPTRFLDAADLARMVETLAAGRGARAAIYNLAGPRPTSLARVLVIAAEAAGVRPKFVGAPMRALVVRGLRPRALPFTWHWSSVLDPSRARRDLGFAPRPIAEWLPRVVRWTVAHRPAESHFGYEQRPAELAAIEAMRARRARLTIAKRGP